MFIKNLFLNSSTYHIHLLVILWRLLGGKITNVTFYFHLVGRTVAFKVRSIWRFNDTQWVNNPLYKNVLLFWSYTICLVSITSPPPLLPTINIHIQYGFKYCDINKSHKLKPNCTWYLWGDVYLVGEGRGD